MRDAGCSSPSSDDPSLIRKKQKGLFRATTYLPHPSHMVLLVLSRVLQGKFIGKPMVEPLASIAEKGDDGSAGCAQRLRHGWRCFHGCRLGDSLNAGGWIWQGSSASNRFNGCPK